MSMAETAHSRQLGPPRALGERRLRWVVLLMLAVHAALLAWGAYQHSPTMDEPTYLAAGISHLTLCRFELGRVSPPLLRMVAAAPVLLAEPKTDWTAYTDFPGSRADWQVARDFLEANGSRSFWLFRVARWACIPFSLLGGYVCFRWAVELYGAPAGLVASALWCFSPNILGHGQLMSPDVGGAAIGVLACYLFWRWLGKPGWGAATGAGVGLGLAELTRTTWLILYPTWILVWLIWQWRARREQQQVAGARAAYQFAFCMLLSLYVLNLGYLFEGSFQKLGKFRFVSETLAGPGSGVGAPGNRLADTWLGELPVPLPRNYVLGIDIQKSDFERRWWSYLGGEHRYGGWWYYYLYGLAVKVPLGTLLLVMLAALRRLGKNRVAWRWRDDLVLILPAVFVFVLVSSQTSFSHHVRYAFLALPFLFVWSGRVGSAFRRESWKTAAVVTAALLWTISSSLTVYPHSLAYFNELVGGPQHGHQHLINSNIDWGQDLLYLRRWLDEHPRVGRLRLAYYGPVDPDFAGIDFTLPPRFSRLQHPGSEAAIHLEPGWYAVSVTFLRGRPYGSYNGRGERADVALYDFNYFLELTPTAMAGYSIYIYRVDEPTTIRGKPQWRDPIT